MAIAHYIDHTVLKQDTRLADIEAVCAEAVQYGFASVCIPPYFVNAAKQNVAGSRVKVATVIGFPFGYSHFEAKKWEAINALEQGADELDMEINVAALLNGDMQTLTAEIETINDAIKGRNTTLKLILETGILTNDQIIACCELYRRYPVQFLKTSTGYAAKGATIEAVSLMRAHLPQPIQIKASGGIRDYVFAQQLIEAGATRLGCSASVAIVKGEPAGAGNY
jgi:deoxyribose-phosphate aldolase